MKFFARLPSAFRYPLAREGLYILIAGWLFFVIVHVLSYIPGPVGGAIGLLGGAYFSACMLYIVSCSAFGDDKFPEWPGVRDWMDDVLHPFVLVVGTLGVCFGPAAAYFFLRLSGGPPFDTIFWWLAIGGALYFPMALLAVAVLDSLSGLNPLLVIPSICRIPFQYVAACLWLLLVVGSYRVLDFLLSEIHPIVPHLVYYFFALYFMAVGMRTLGLLYDSTKDRLKWL